MLLSTKVISWAAASAESVVLAASLEAAVVLDTSAMFWGSLEPHALSSETASTPANAALMVCFFMVVPSLSKILLG